METNTAVLCASKVIADLLESSSSSDDDEMHSLLVERNIVPRVKNFIENVIYQYSESDVSKGFLGYRLPKL